MSYDCDLVNPKTKAIALLPFKLNFRNANMVVGGTDMASQNITFNYADILRKVMPPKGIWSLNGITAKDSIKVLTKAMYQLKDDIDEDYWKPTEGNVKIALTQLLEMTVLVPEDSVWEISG